MYKIHPTADVHSKDIGKDTRIWQFVVVLPGAKIGMNCNICSHCYIENKVVIGNNVTIKFFVELCDGVTLEDDVFIAPHVSFTNDMVPRSKKYLDQPVKTTVKRGASIGANVTIIPGITVGEYSFIAAGSVLTKDTRAYTYWMGVPARQVGTVTKDGELIKGDKIP